MKFKNITIAGGGVLGSQIAFQTAFSGYNVKVWLRSEASIERAKPKFERLKNIYLSSLDEMDNDSSIYYRGFGPKENLTHDKIQEMKDTVIKAYDNILLTTSYSEAFNDADFVIECVAENPTEKISFYEELSKHLPEKTVLATNSSTMLPSSFAKYTARPEKFLALHFANEIWRNNTAEIMGHDKTDQKYYDEIVEFAESINMIPLKLKKEQPGYILNTMLVPLLNSASYLYANGVADIETIDKTWTIATGAPMGPFRILDIVGLTTAYNIVSMSPDASDPESKAYKIATMLKSYIDQGKTGINAGEGFYKYK